MASNDVISPISSDVYRSIFDTIEQGVCICRIILDEGGEPVDYEFIEVNSLFEDQTGLRNAAGHSALSLVPDLERSWIETYGEVAIKRTPRRFQQGSEAMGRWFDVHAFPVGTKESGLFGIVFSDITARRQSQVALRESEERFRIMADNAPVMVWVTEVDGNCTYLSKSWYEFTGQTEESGLGYGWLIAVHPDDAAAAEAIFSDATRHQKPFRIEYRLKRKDGQFRWAIDSAAPRLGSNGEFLGFIGSVIDITERKQMEEQLRRSEERYRLIIESQKELVCRFRPDGSIVFVNEAYARNAGRSAEELQTGNFWGLIPEADRTVVRAELDRLTPSSPWVQIENRFETTAGTRWTLWTNTALTFDDNHRWLEAQATGIDITQRKLAEQERDRVVAALAQSEHRYRTLFETMNEGFALQEIVFDDDGSPRDFRHLAVNPAFERHTGLRISQIIGKNVREIFPEAEKVWLDRFAGVVRTGQPIHFEEQFRPLNRWFAVSAFRVDGNRLASVFSDITDKKRAEEALVKQAKELEQFAYVSSHDLQEPLRKVSNYSDILRDRFAAALPADAERYLEGIQKSAIRMQTLITDLLSYSRLGRNERRQEPVDMNAVLRRVTEDLETTINTKKAVITNEPLPSVTGDPVQLHQLLANLVSNALKFVRNQAPRVRISAVHLEGFWQFSVEDNGIGIEAEFRERIFGVFQRLHTRSTFEGTGIGLAICRKVVESHGGRLWVDEGPDGGCAFRFTLPSIPPARE